ncbi:MAG: DUF4982 domain-containing protein, partial [Anaerolineales bacterium]|nr:DUF4982 domain-containing protein [Anaerolineales bacterium]
PIPYVNQKGLVDRAGNPKDAFFLFQAVQTTQPVCYIESPSWPVRTGKPGELKRLRVYSNCERVTLYVNGRSHGTKFPNPEITPAGGLVWFVPLQMGDNQIRAVAETHAGQTIEHAIVQTLVSNGAAAVAAMRGWCERVAVGGETAVLVTVQLTAHNGVPVLADERRLRFSLAGAGQLVADRGTPTGSRVIETGNGRAAIIVLDCREDSRICVTCEGLPDLDVAVDNIKWD